MSYTPNNTAFRYENGNSYFVKTVTADYTLTPNDNGVLIVTNSASAVVITVPQYLPVGFCCRVVRSGAGAVSFTASSTTINYASADAPIANQYGVADVVSVAMDSFVIGEFPYYTAPAPPSGVEGISSLVHRWNVTSLSALADNDPVATWADDVGTADLTASGSAQPVYKANAGDPYVLFDGTDDYMSTTLTAISGDFTYVMVVRAEADGADYERFFDDGLIALFPTVSIGRTLYATLNGSGASDAAYPAAGTDMVLFVEGTGTPTASMRLRRNGTQNTGAGSGAAGTSTALRLGADQGGTVFMNMRVREFFQFNNDLTVDEFVVLSDYINATYGLSL